MKHVWNSREWYVWEQNASPMLLVMTLNPSMRELREYLGSPLFTTLIVFETDDQGNYQGKWVFRLEEGKYLGQKMVDMLLCPPYRVSFDTGLETAEAGLVQKSREIQFSTDFQQYDNDQLVALFEEFCQIYYTYYKFAAFVEPVQWQTEYILTALLKDRLSKEAAETSQGEGKLAEDLRALFTIEQDTFAVEILRHLCQCAETLHEFLKRNPELAQAIRGVQSDEDFLEKAARLILPAIRTNGNQHALSLIQRLKEHSFRYYWKKNNYYSTTFITEEDVLEELFGSEGFDLADAASSYKKLLAKIRESKAELLSKKAALTSTFPAYYHNVVGLANTVGGSMVDRRKKVVQTANAAFDRILSAVADRTGTPIDDVRLLIPQELSYFVASPEEYRQRFIDRRKLFLVYQSDFPLVDDLLSGIGMQTEDDICRWRVQPMNDPFLAEGDHAEKILEHLNLRLNLFTGVGMTSNKLQGITTYYDPSQPELRGIARVIRNPKTESLRTDEILVAPSTTPDYIDAIERCKAIITDWGGQTSHAAITSRELKKPCIIGTNFGSQVVRNGDQLSLDFVHGLIEIVSFKGG